MPSLTEACSRHVTAWEAIPEPFQPFIQDDRALPYLIYSPSDTWGRHKVNARLTMLSDQGVSILESTSGGVRVRKWTFTDIDYVEQGTVLLYSWLRLSGVVNGRLTAIQVEYNAAAEPLFTRLAQAVRMTWMGSGTGNMERDKENLFGLAAMNYKFGNYARESILRGVLATVFQPEITKPFLIFFRRRLAAAYLCVLTDKELIFLSNDNSEGAEDTSRYGVVRRYIPLTKIQGWKLESAACNKTGIWRLELPGELLTMHFSAQAQSSLLVLVSLLDEVQREGE